MNWEYRPFGDWAIDLLTLFARDESKGFTRGTLNTSAASLALNGTISSGGSLTVAVPNSTIVFNKLPLTPASALDIWNPPSTNQTSPDVRSAIVNNYQARDYVMQDAQIRLQASGTAFDLPAGPLKVAFGVEANRWVLQEAGNQTNGSGPADVGSTYQIYSLPRNIYSGFGEAIIPIISPDAGLWGVQKFDIDLSARYDHYSDFGATTNPKASFNWQVYDDLKLRGNYSTSFVAPSIDEVGTRDLGLSTLQSYGDVGSPGNFNLPVSTFPLLPQMGIPGCTTASVTCNISSLKGLQVTTGDKDMHPDRGRSWSLGADFNPSFLPGLSLSGTLWWVHVKGAVQSSNLSFVATNPSLAFLLTLYPPPGATAADIAAATKGILGTAAISPGIQYIFQSKNSDWENIQYMGTDFNIAYTFDTDDWGSFTVSDTGSIIMNAHQGFGLHADVPPRNYYSITNTVGTNGTFSTIANQQRFMLAWAMDPFEMDFTMNYTGSFHNWGAGALKPTITNASGNPIGGGDIVESQEIFNLHASYSFSGGILGDDSVSLTVTNLFNNKPPFENTATGVDTRNGSLLERGISIGLTSRF
jgi:iron complex outermembrane receptor protein